MRTRISPLALALLLVFFLSQSASAFVNPRPVQTEGKLMIGWAMGEIAAIGEHKLIGFQGKLHEALRGCNGLELRLSGYWTSQFVLHTTRIELLEAAPDLDSIVRLNGRLEVKDGQFTMRNQSFQPSGPLVKALTRCHDQVFTLEATRDGDTLRVFSLEIPLPPAYPWIPGTADARN